MKQVSKEDIYQALKKVMDPELRIDIVSLGLIYDVTVGQIQTPKGEKQKIHILMTLTTPGCPLIGVLDQMIREEVGDLEGVKPDEIDLELTFDPPWVTEMMSPEARAELGL